VVETLCVFASGTGDQFKFPWSCLVLCLNNTLLEEVFASAKAELGKDFQLVMRSEVPSIKKEGKWLPKKDTEIAARGKIAFANVHDAKGNDADVILLIEPDDSGASTLNKRALFYVAATRAKEHLIVLGIAANSTRPILEDAASTANVLAKLSN